MKVAGKSVIITGAGNGIGKALALRFVPQGAKVAAADVDLAAAQQTAGEGGTAVTAYRCDVTSEQQVRELVTAVGQVDLFCSNAGILVEGGPEAPDEEWERSLSVNFRAHLYAMRAVLPQMLGRGEGYLLQVISAAGLLTSINAAPYAVSKHAALALAEWMSIEYGDQGIRVSCVCPMGVRTRMLLGDDGSRESFLLARSISPEEVADWVIRGVEEERFLILPHPEVLTYFQRKASDYDRWLGGMRRMKRSIDAG